MISLAALSAFPNFTATQQVTRFKGRVVMLDDGLAPGRLTVRLGEFGSTATNDAGFFAVPLPAGTRSVTVQVETGDPKWVVRYPSGPIPVPADTSFVTDIMVGLSIEANLARAYAITNSQLAQRLEAAGVKQDQTLDILDRMRADFASRTQLEAEELRIAAQRETDRVREYRPIAAAIERYVTAANDLQNAFIFISDQAFTNDSAYAELKKSVRDYNGAFDTLQTNRMSFEATVRTYWGSDRISSDLRDFFDYALGEVHRVRILSLNGTQEPITKIAKGQVKGSEAKKLQQETEARIDTTVRELAPRLEELGRRKDRILLELQPGEH
jgi:hypothetical protein